MDWNPFEQKGGAMIIQEAELFEGVSQETMSEIAKIMVEESYDKGTVLFAKGDPADHFYVPLKVVV